MKTPCILIIFLALFSFKTPYAQVSKDSEFFIALKKADSLLFERGFNHCDFNTLEQLITEDFEFYHDENGTQNRTQFFTGFKESICANPQVKPIRKVIDESLAVFRLKNNGATYGAIQKGIHLFYIKEPNKPLYLTNIAKFTSVWMLEDGQWKLSRVLSYDHQTPNKDYGPKFNANFPAPLFEDDAEVTKLLKQHHIPSIALGYIEDGNIKQLRSFGVQKDTVPVSVNTLYKVASLTKPVAAIIALKLIDKGLLTLDEPLSKYYIDPDIKDHPYLNKLTARHVLSHQSGFLNWRYLDKENTLTFEFEPGTKFQYSGEGFEYLRKAIEHKLQQPFEKIAETLLFKPLGMNNTYFNWTPQVNESRYAVEHDEHGKPIAFKKHTTASTAANLLTTTADYATFMIHILNGAGVSESLYTEFLTSQVQEKKGIARNLGMQLLTHLPNDDIALMHTGGDYGIKTIAIIFLKSKKGLVLFSNAENGMVLWQKIITEYFGDLGTEIVKRNLE